jgi:predicted Zn finger-like uncharacterized protein
MPNTPHQPEHRICDYEGSHYRTEFWENSDRAYEDAVERIAIRNLLPATGNRLIEIGAGYGRLATLYQGYRQVVLLDYARTQLQEARRHLGDDPRFIYVIGNVYNLPFTDNNFDSLTMIRVMHHLTNVPDALTELNRILRPSGTAVIEHANKQNLKAILRYVTGQQQWNPFKSPPVEFVDLNFNFHPAWIRKTFSAAGLNVKQIRTLSHFRIALLKRTLPLNLLVAMDRLAQNTGNLWQLSPSVCLQAIATKKTDSTNHGFFRCPNCKSAALVMDKKISKDSHLLTCHTCNHGWRLHDGIYDFKTPYKT